MERGKQEAHFSNREFYSEMLTLPHDVVDWPGSCQGGGEESGT